MRKMRKVTRKALPRFGAAVVAAALMLTSICAPYVPATVKAEEETVTTTATTDNLEDITALAALTTDDTVTEENQTDIGHLTDGDYTTCYDFAGQDISEYTEGKVGANFQFQNPYKVEAVEVAFECNGTAENPTDSSNFEFTFNIQGKTASDEEWTKLTGDLTSTRDYGENIQTVALTEAGSYTDIRVEITNVTSTLTTGNWNYPKLAEIRLFADVAGVEARYSTNRIHWLAIDEAASYEVLYKANEETEEYTAVTTVTAEEGTTEYEYIHTADVGSQYQYQIKAIKDAETYYTADAVADIYPTGIEAVQQHAKEDQLHIDFSDTDIGRTFDGNRIYSATEEEVDRIKGLEEGTVMISFKPEDSTTRMGLFVAKNTSVTTDTTLGGSTQSDSIAMYWDYRNLTLGVRCGFVGGLQWGPANYGLTTGDWITYSVRNMNYDSNTTESNVFDTDGTGITTFDKTEWNGFFTRPTSEINSFTVGGTYNSETAVIPYTGQIAYVTVTDELMSDAELKDYTLAVTESLKNETDSYILPTDDMTAAAGCLYSSNGATNVLDGSASTHWHSDWATGHTCSMEHLYLEIGMNEATIIDSVRYLPREGAGGTDGGANGVFLGYKILVKESEDAEYVEVASGTWANAQGWKTAKFDPVKAQYVKIQATSTAGTTTDKFGSAAEIRITTPVLEDGRQNVESYKGTRDDANWVAPASGEENQAFAGWYEDEACTTVYTKTHGNAYPKFVNIETTETEEGMVGYKGGSLRKDYKVEGEESYNYEKTCLRFGYDFTLPEGVDIDSVSWTWNFGKENITDWSLRGRNYTERDGVITSNLVLTNIAVSNFEQQYNVKLTLSYKTADGTQVTVQEPSTRAYSVSSLVTKISEDANADESDKAYAKGVADALTAYKSEQQGE